MPVDGRKPFTELYESVQRELIREAASGEDAKYRGLINQVYINDLPAILPERYIRKDAFITTIADYTTGTVTVNSTTNIVGASTSWTSANSDELLISISGYDLVPRMNYVAATSLDFLDSIGWTESSSSGLNYTLFQDRYQLASDFAYMAKDDPNNPNVVYRYVNGVKTYLTPWSNQDYDRDFTTNIGDLHAYTVKWISRTPYLYVQSNPDDVENVGYSYIPRIVQLRELTTGTATVSGASGTSVVLTTNASMTASLDTARTLYFRNDADGTGSSSVWAQITTVTDATTATLNSTQSASITSGASLTYTISEVSEWPERFDDVIMHKAAWIADPDAVQAEKWATLINDALGTELTVETKRTRQSTLKSFPGLRR
jgi:hypothetical protein